MMDNFLKNTRNNKTKTGFDYVDKALGTESFMEHAKKNLKNIRWVELGPRRNQSHEFREGYHKS